MSDEVEDMVVVGEVVYQHLTLILSPLYAAAECSAAHYVVHYNHRTYSKEAADVDTVYSYYSCSDAAAAYACDAVVD